MLSLREGEDNSLASLQPRGNFLTLVFIKPTPFFPDFQRGLKGGRHGQRGSMLSHLGVVWGLVVAGVVVVTVVVVVAVAVDVTLVVVVVA